MMMHAKLATSAIASTACLASGLVSAQVDAIKKAEAPRPVVKVEVKGAGPAVTVEFLPTPEKTAEKAVEKAQAKATAKIEEKAPTKAAIAPMLRLAPAQVVLPPAPGAPAVDLEPLTKQMLQQLRPMFRAELRFLTSACEPSATQRREIAIEGGRALKDAAKKVAEVQQALQNGGWRGGVIPDARKQLREGMLAAAKAKLPPEQFARYEAELDKRLKDQRQAIMLNLVASMDKILILSPEQRTKLGDSLLEHWDERVFPSLENVVNYESNSYFPNIPDQYITPVLGEAQQKAWRGIQKVTFGQSFNFNFNNGMANGAEPEDADEDEKAALAEEVKKP